MNTNIKYQLFYSCFLQITHHVTITAISNKEQQNDLKLIPSYFNISLEIL